MSAVFDMDNLIGWYIFFMTSRGFLPSVNQATPPSSAPHNFGDGDNIGGFTYDSISLWFCFISVMLNVMSLFIK